MDIKILENLLQETIDRGNLRTRHHHYFSKKDGDLGFFFQHWRSAVDARSIRET